MGPFLRSSLTAATFLVLAFPAFAVFAADAELQLKSSTLIRYFERDVGTEKDQQVVPAYEYLQVDYGPAGSDLSFHGYGWMRINLGDEFFEDEAEAELLYGYAEYRPKNQDFALRLGRQYIFEGVANESVDGLWGSVDLHPFFSVSGYAGFPVALEDTDGRQGDGIFGARASVHRLGKFDLGASYKFVANESDRDEEVVGGDLSLFLPGGISVLGYSTWNLVEDEWGEHSYEARFSLWRFELRPLFQYYTSDGFFSDRENSAGPFRAQPFLESDTRIYGAETYFYPSEDYEFAVKYKHYEYDERFGSANFYSGLASYKWNIFSQVGGEVGRMEGDAAENRYLLGRGFFYLNLTPAFITGDVVYVAYDENFFGRGESFFASLGAGRGFFRNALKLKLSMDYSSDPNFDDDLRTLLVADFQLDR